MKPRECKKMISNEPLKVVCGTIARSGNTCVLFNNNNCRFKIYKPSRSLMSKFKGFARTYLN